MVFQLILLQIIILIFLPVVLDNVEVAPDQILPFLAQTFPSSQLVQKVNSPPLREIMFKSNLITM